MIVLRKWNRKRNLRFLSYATVVIKVTLRVKAVRASPEAGERGGRRGRFTPDGDGGERLRVRRIGK